MLKFMPFAPVSPAVSLFTKMLVLHGILSTLRCLQSEPTIAMLTPSGCSTYARARTEKEQNSALRKDGVSSYHDVCCEDGVWKDPGDT